MPCGEGESLGCGVPAQANECGAEHMHRALGKESSSIESCVREKRRKSKLEGRFCGEGAAGQSARTPRASLGMCLEITIEAEGQRDDASHVCPPSLI